tara:strand:+ start:125 stop:382 length:258 start_codon:yes stop_codon:yes gene_type:complete
MYKKFFDLLVIKYRKVEGSDPEGLDLLKIKQEAAEKVRQQEKIIKFPEGGRDRVPVKKQFNKVKSLKAFKAIEDAYEKAHGWFAK